MQGSLTPRTSWNFTSRDCLESPDGHQTGATEANIEGQGDRIFALQASDLASLTPLQPTFQTVSRRGILGSSEATALQRWSHELGVVLLVYLLHGPASARAPIRIFSMLGPQLSELLEGVLQAPRYVGRQHLARLSSYTLGGVNRPPRDEDERPGRRTDLALTDQEEKLSL